MEPKELLGRERKTTDASLGAERSKTNKSLSKERREVEEKIDKTVSKDRVEADRVMADSRIEADAENGHRNGDERVIDERERADSAVELERSQVDSALEKEREVKRALAGRLLEQERKLTDKSLSHERDRTDSEFTQRSSLLSEEVSSHSKTKVELTTRDEFLAIVSHDLRNPIGAASSCADMLLEDSTYSRIDPEIKHWIEFIKRNVDVSLRLISDLLDMERMASGKFELDIKAHSIGQLIRHSVETFVHKASAKGVLLRIVPVGVAEDKVLMDDDRILQVLSNLIGNALKFTPERGTITIRTVISDSEAQVSIQDTGPGIAEEKQKQIFERFAQLGSNDRSGLGLGLYISRMLIEAHGGRIWVESKVGEGSVFSFAIPVLGTASGGHVQ